MNKVLHGRDMSHTRTEMCEEASKTRYLYVWSSITWKIETVHYWHIERTGYHQRHAHTEFLFTTFKDNNVFPQLNLSLMVLMNLTSLYHPSHHPLLLEKDFISVWGWLATLRLWTLCNHCLILYLLKKRDTKFHFKSFIALKFFLTMTVPALTVSVMETSSIWVLHHLFHFPYSP